MRLAKAFLLLAVLAAYSYHCPGNFQGTIAALYLAFLFFGGAMYYVVREIGRKQFRLLAAPIVVGMIIFGPVAEFVIRDN